MSNLHYAASSHTLASLNLPLKPQAAAMAGAPALRPSPDPGSGYSGHHDGRGKPENAARRPRGGRSRPLREHSLPQHQGRRPKAQGRSTRAFWRADGRGYTGRRRRAQTGWPGTAPSRTASLPTREPSARAPTTARSYRRPMQTLTRASMWMAAPRWCSYP